jgi:hypothetical protein
MGPQTTGALVKVEVRSLADGSGLSVFPDFQFSAAVIILGIKFERHYAMRDHKMSFIPRLMDLPYAST